MSEHCCNNFDYESENCKVDTQTCSVNGFGRNVCENYKEVK